MRGSARNSAFLVAVLLDDQNKGKGAEAIAAEFVKAQRSEAPDLWKATNSHKRGIGNQNAKIGAQ